MTRIDYYIQTGLILLGAFLLLLSILSGGVLVVWAQLMLGPWQIISSICYLLGKAPFRKARILHLIISILYLVLLFAFFKEAFKFDKVLALLMVTIPPWTLAFYYYIITCLTVFPKKKNDSAFLPHLNF